MNTQEFLDTLERQNLVSGETIQKLRNKVEQTDRQVTAKSIAKYLIDKGLLSKFQAKQLLFGIEKPSEDLEIRVPEEQVHDTSELLKDLNPVAVPDQPDEVVEHVMPDYEQSIEVVDVEHEMTMQHGILGQPIPAQPIETETMYDPLGGNLETLPHDTGQSRIPSFAGKKAIKNQWESKWLFIGFGLLGLLTILGVILWYTLFKTDAEKMWQIANENFTNGRYQAAIKDYLRFVKTYPSDERAPLARVYVANCELRMPYDTERWETTLEKIKTVLPRLQTELEQSKTPERFEEIRDELSVIIPGTALGFADLALKTDDIDSKQKLLDLALDGQEQIDNSAYVPTSQQRKPGVEIVLKELGNKISIIERQIQMEHDYTSALADVQNLTNEGQTESAFAVLNQLEDTYPILKIRAPFREAKAAISMREADLVNKIEFRTSPVEKNPSSIISTVVVATRWGDSPIPGLSNETLVYLVNGAFYGIRAADGQGLWRQFVGAETENQPQWLDEPFRGDVIATNARRNHLMRIGSIDGTIKWRVDIGEPFANPVVDAGEITLTTKSGKVMQIDPENGSVDSATQIPMTAGTSGVTNNEDPYIYQLGRNANLYVISTETKQCREVFYVGHRADSVAVPPFVIARHIIVAQNGPNYCLLHIIRPTENGLKLEQAQPPIRLSGQVTTPFIRYGRWGLVLTDAGDIRMLEVNFVEDADPVTVVIREQFSSGRDVRTHTLAADSQLWTAGSGLRRYKIQKATGNFDQQEIANNLDTFLGPVTKIDDTLFHLRRRNGSALVSLSAVDSKTLKEKWRTDFGAPLAGPPIESGDQIQVVSSQGDVFQIDSETLERGFTTEPVSRGSNIAQNLVFDHILQLDPQRFVVTGPLDRRNILSIDGTKSPANKLSELESPADRPSCQPIMFGNSLLVPSKKGQVVRINPRNGSLVGAPFQPPLKPGVDVDWLEPAIIADGQEFMIADKTGRFFLVAADADTSLQKIAESQFAGTVRSRLLLVGETVFAVCQDNLSDKIVEIPAGIEIEFGKSVELPGGFVAGPVKIDDSSFVVMLEDGNLICYNTGLEEQWKVELPADKIAGNPELTGNEIVVAFQSGDIWRLNGQSGETVLKSNIGQPISSPPRRLGGRVFISGADGTLHEISSE